MAGDNGHIDVGQILDIAELTNELCAKLGLTPRFVRSLTITPSQLLAEVYQADEHGNKHIDQATGLPATQTIEYTIIT